MFRITVGQGPLVAGAHNALALRIADFAVLQGFVFTGIQLSRNAGSVSRYLALRDRRGRPWLIRVSNHPRPTQNPNVTPQLDLVSHDGRAGFDETCEFLTRVFEGRVPWFDPATEPGRVMNRARR